MGERPILAIDSCSDIPASIVETLDVEELHFPFTLDGEERFDDFGRTLPHKALFDAMRNGSQPTTAQIPPKEFERVFEAAAQAGRPLVYLGFSSGMSGTFDSAHLVRDAVLERHPGADIRLVDTKVASAAEGFLVLEAARVLDGGADADELVSWVEGHKARVNGFFTLESLEWLRRGGRISDAAAAAGTVLDIKPILSIDRDGKLVLKRSVRGRKRSIATLIDIMADRYDPRVHSDRVVVAHADAPVEAATLVERIEERFSPGEITTFEIGPVIGAHVGPGMLAVVFWGPER